jgi:2-iminoacetate synthase
VSFSSEFRSLPLGDLVRRAESTGPGDVDWVLSKRQVDPDDFPVLLSTAASERLEELCRRSQALTLQRFGRVIRMFAPLYLSNECINNCKYCGFSRDNPILRVTLSLDDVRREGEELARQGFRNVLLVAGEHPRFVSTNYLRDCVAALRNEFSSVSLEVGPMETSDYKPLAEAGAEGLVVYQETYDRAIYEQVHTAGPKKDFDWRLDTPERAYAGGFRRLGIAALYGLADWRAEAIALAAHAEYLLRNCWKAQLAISLPRLRPHAGEFQPLTQMSDRQLVQLVCAFRLKFPDAALVLSTRESARLRDGLFPIGITHISAGSHTEPGGYTGAGRENIHKTERGRIVALDLETASAARPRSSARDRTAATGQFEIADERSPGEIAEVLKRLGYEPVWKDWDTALSA